MYRYKSVIVLLLLAVSFFLVGCEAKIPEDQIVARVNGYEMTIDDLREKIEFSPYTRNKMPDNEKMLDIAIEEQVLIQEAQKRGLDRNKTFMKTIERYWQQTLIKELLQQENERIIKNVNKEDQTEALKSWIKELKSNAKIEKYDEVLEKVK